jgi:hypothetical protein
MPTTSLLELLPQSNLGLQGITPAISIFDTIQSPLHNTYSLNGDPNLINQPNPSLLDLNGEIPTISTVPGSTQPYPYLDNLPG